MKKFVMFLSIVACSLLLCACENKTVKTELKGVTQNKYNVYFNMEGINCTVEEAKTKIRHIITDLGYGYTEYMAYGAYLDENKKAIESETLVYMLIYMEEDKVKEIVTRAKEEVGIKSVLYEVTSVYNGFAEEQ